MGTPGTRNHGAGTLPTEARKLAEPYFAAIGSVGSWSASGLRGHAQCRESWGRYFACSADQPEPRAKSWGQAAVGSVGSWSASGLRGHAQRRELWGRHFVCFADLPMVLWVQEGTQGPVDMPGTPPALL